MWYVKLGHTSEATERMRLAGAGKEGEGDKRGQAIVHARLQEQNFERGL